MESHDIRCNVCQQPIDFTLPSTQDNCLECMLNTINQSLGPIVLFEFVFGLTAHAYEKSDPETQKRFMEKTQQILLKIGGQ